MVRERFNVPAEIIPSSVTELADIVDSMDALADFIAEKTGLVIRTDWNAYQPSYAPNLYVIFFAQSEESTVPEFCLLNMNATRSDYLTSYRYICNCTLIGNEFRPAYIEGFNYYGKRRDGCFGFLTSQLQILQRTTFDDGRKVFHFMSNLNGSGIPTNSDKFMYHPINVDGEKTWRWIVFGSAPNPSYLEEIDAMCYESYGTQSNSDWMYTNINYMINNHGYIPDSGKEYMVKRDLWIGPRTRIPNMIEFSNKGYKYHGGIVTINSVKYLVVDGGGGGFSGYIMTDEV